MAGPRATATRMVRVAGALLSLACPLLPPAGPLHSPPSYVYPVPPCCVCAGFCYRVIDITDHVAHLKAWLKQLEDNPFIANLQAVSATEQHFHQCAHFTLAGSALPHALLPLVQ